MQNRVELTSSRRGRREARSFASRFRRHETLLALTLDSMSALIPIKKKQFVIVNTFNGARVHLLENNPVTF